MHTFCVHLVIKVYDDLRTQCLLTENNSPFLSDIKANLLVALNEKSGYRALFGSRVDDQRPIYWEATVLNPTLKELAFEQITDDFRACVKKHVREVLRKKYGEPKSHKASFTGRRAAKRARRQSDLGMTIWVAISEIDKFVRMDIIGDEEELDMIEREPWVQQNKSKLKYAREMAMVRFSILAANVPSERSNSSAGRVITYDRNRLSPRKVNLLLQTSSWYRAGYCPILKSSE